MYSFLDVILTYFEEHSCNENTPQREREREREVGERERFS